MKWPIKRLVELSAPKKYSLIGGPFGSNLGSRDYISDGVPVIRGVNLPDHSPYLFGNFVFISERKADQLISNNAHPGDIVFTQRGTIGQVGLIPKNSPFKRFVISQSQMKLTVDETKADAYFLYCYFRLPGTVQAIKNLAMSSGIPHINLDILRQFEVPAPPLPIQQKIAAILSSYDNLIENNKRRITLLEKMAEEIYREWFVRMRFPGYKTARFNKGVPDGWKKVPLDKAFKFTGGGTPSKKIKRYWANGNINWFTPSDITSSKGIFLDCSGERCTDEGLSKSSARLFPAYSIMMTSRATIGAVGINMTPACTNQGFITCMPNKRYPLEFLYHWLKLSKPHFELLSGGATFPELTKTTFKKIEILTPPKELVFFFADSVAPTLKAIEKLLQANVNLENTRDMLLPRLISGRLLVEELKIQLPPSMQFEQDNAHA